LSHPRKSQVSKISLYKVKPPIYINPRQLFRRRKWAYAPQDGDEPSPHSYGVAIIAAEANGGNPYTMQAGEVCEIYDPFEEVTLCTVHAPEMKFGRD